MPETAVVHSTFVLERNFYTTPERVFQAFADPEKKRRWFFESRQHELQLHKLDFKVGGWERAQLVFGPGTPVSGMTCINETVYEDIVPDRRIVAAYRMLIGGKCVSVALVTMEMLPAQEGTELTVTHQGAFFEGSGGPEMRKGGWIALLDKLAAELKD
jgi:uncharacterized protein YndB with AHSA1/START domain